MGEVYSARDTRIDRTVAIKVLAVDASRDLEAEGRFEREARALATLNQRHTCLSARRLQGAAAGVVRSERRAHRRRRQCRRAGPVRRRRDRSTRCRRAARRGWHPIVAAGPRSWIDHKADVGGASVWAPVLSRDGRSLTYIARQEGRTTVVERPAHGGAGRIVFDYRGEGVVYLRAMAGIGRGRGAFAVARRRPRTVFHRTGRLDHVVGDHARPEVRLRSPAGALQDRRDRSGYSAFRRDRGRQPIPVQHDAGGDRAATTTTLQEMLNWTNGLSR